uniref:Secreted protein n=1 Tax=Ascaris lumbricoides TaxID=6252 RepID=A0A0M3HPJ9_ASCLU
MGRALCSAVAVVSLPEAILLRTAKSANGGNARCACLCVTSTASSRINAFGVGMAPPEPADFEPKWETTSSSEPKDSFAWWLASARASSCAH